jgi:hypothetical protein
MYKIIALNPHCYPAIERHRGERKRETPTLLEINVRPLTLTMLDAGVKLPG